MAGGELTNYEGNNQKTLKRKKRRKTIKKMSRIFTLKREKKKLGSQKRAWAKKALFFQIVFDSITFSPPVKFRPIKSNEPKVNKVTPIFVTHSLGENQPDPIWGAHVFESSRKKKTA